MSQHHRHTPPGEHEHEFEPQRGLPEALPAQEQLIWQGSPDERTLAIEVFHVRKACIYFAMILLLRGAYVLQDGGSLGDAGLALMWLLPLVVFAVALLWYMSRLTARTTVYTITDKRIVMRIGIALTLTFNLPFNRIAAANAVTRRNGTGDIALSLLGEDKIAYAHLWPHARPWRVAKPEPMLRALPEVQRVAALLTAAWSARTGIAATAPTIETAVPAAPLARPQVKRPVHEHAALAH
jgi:Bacterial PH domain